MIDGRDNAARDEDQAEALPGVLGQVMHRAEPLIDRMKHHRQATYAVVGAVLLVGLAIPATRRWVLRAAVLSLLAVGGQAGVRWVKKNAATVKVHSPASFVQEAQDAKRQLEEATKRQQDALEKIAKDAP